MGLKIRLRQQGRTNRPFYRVVVTDSRSPRDGKYLESVGWYNPFESEQDKLLSLDAGRIEHWINLGAQMTETVGALMERGAPAIMHKLTERSVIRRSKALAKRKARKKVSA